MDTLEHLKNIVDPNPALSHKFGVTFMTGGASLNQIDFKFQKVSGISADIQLETLNEGGQNLYNYKLPNKVNYNNLVLERGFSTSQISSPLSLEFNTTFSSFKFYPSNVLVTLYNEVHGVVVPVSAWFFIKAYPVKWSVGELNAESDSVLIDTMELAYTRFQSIRV